VSARPPLVALLPGSAGRWPFAGHVRGVGVAAEAGSVAWAGRVGTGLPPEEAWEAAEALRDCFAAWTLELGYATTSSHALTRLWPHLRALPARWATRADLCFVAAAHDGARMLLTGVGLDGVLVETGSGWVVAALSGSPLLGETGLPAHDPAPQPPLRTGARVIGLPPGAALPAADKLDLACGLHP
jgi:hypothetical protein